MRVRTLLGCTALSLSLLACARDGDGDDDPGPTVRGALTLALTAADSGGVEYRLRNAQFEITGYPDGYYPMYPWPDDDGGVIGSGGQGGSSGYPSGYVSIVVSSETDPEAPAITLRLVPGQYNVALLNDDWYLERTTDTGIERVERAVLLSQRYQYAYVYDGGFTQITYTFGVDGEFIDFRSGELQIGISIEKPGEHCPGYGGRGGTGGPCGAAGFAGGFGEAGRGAPIP